MDEHMLENELGELVSRLANTVTILENHTNHESPRLQALVLERQKPVIQNILVEAQNLLQKNKQLNQQLVDGKMRMEEKEINCDKLTETTQQLNKTLKQAITLNDDKIEAAEKKYKTMESMLKLSEANFTYVKNQNTKIDANYTTLQSELNSTEAQYNEMSKKYDQLKLHHDMGERNLKNAEAKIEALEKEKKELATSYTNSIMELTKSVEEKSSLHSKELSKLGNELKSFAGSQANMEAIQVFQKALDSCAAGLSSLTTSMQNVPEMTFEVLEKTSNMTNTVNDVDENIKQLLRNDEQGKSDMNQVTTYVRDLASQKRKAQTATELSRYSTRRILTPTGSRRASAQGTGLYQSPGGNESTESFNITDDPQLEEPQLTEPQVGGQVSAELLEGTASLESSPLLERLKQIDEKLATTLCQIVRIPNVWTTEKILGICNELAAKVTSMRLSKSWEQIFKTASVLRKDISGPKKSREGFHPVCLLAQVGAEKVGTIVKDQKRAKCKFHGNPTQVKNSGYCISVVDVGQGLYKLVENKAEEPQTQPSEA